LGVFSDGHVHCFSCGYHMNGTTMTETKEEPTKNAITPVAAVARDLPHRKIPEETCRKFGYGLAKMNDDIVEVAQYWRDGHPVAQKFRTKDKRFWVSGNIRGCELFGQHLWKAGGKKLIVTEGEIDCMTVSTAQDNRWPVVSLPNGAAGAVQSIKDNLDFVTSYDEIVLAFDMDDAGRAASRAVAEILPPGKVRIASFPRKDANEMWLAGEGRAMIDCLWQASTYFPDGILHVRDVTSGDRKTCDVWDYPWPAMTDFLIGQRSGEIVLWTSGTGSGKSTIVRELAMHHLNAGRPVGMIMLEESPEETVDDLISLLLQKPVRKIRATEALNRLREATGRSLLQIADLDEIEYGLCRDRINQLPLYIYDHLGSHGYGNLMSRMEYMAVSLGCRVIILDHITAAVTGMVSSDEFQGERLVIDEFMKQMRSLVERTGVHLDVISQLRKTTQGKGYEEGARITLQDLRGSGSLGSVPNIVVAMERDRQSPDMFRANTSVMRVLKNRFTGRTGVATALYYDAEAGRLREVNFAMDDSGDVMFDPDGIPQAEPSLKAPKDMF
jgi:twinkle protein